MAWFVIVLPCILFFGLQDSVFLVLLLSLYANAAGDISSWQAARAEREVKKGNGPDNSEED